MRRREFLQGSASLSLAGLLPLPALAQSSYVPDKIIDAHCHVFNADDLPLVDFVEKVVARTFLEKKEVVPHAPLVHAVLLDIARRLQRKAKDEGEYLDRIKGHPDKQRSTAEKEEYERQIIRDLYADWVNRGVGRIPRGEKLAPATIQAYLPRIALGFIRRELMPRIYSGPKDFSLGSIFDNGDQAFTLEETDSVIVGHLPAIDTKYLADQTYDNAQGEITFNIKWAVAFSRYRLEMVQTLHEVNQKRTILVTPALVDFSGWLDTKEPRTSIAQQVNIMERISREAPKGTPHVHGFVAFDPLRQAVHDKLGKPADQSPLAVVTKAVMKQGFIGVKLYPPMGFRASTNAAAGNDFPCWVRFGSGSSGYGEKCEDPKNTADGLGNEPGTAIDAALIKLYDWCVANNVPIMVHTNNSQSAGPGYGTRADPKYWKPVLDRYPTLRVNFAHFGGFDEAYTDGRLNLSALTRTWEWTIGAMTVTNPERPIFSDFSYFSELLDDKSRIRRETLTCMRRFREQFPDCDRVLLYGTDWSMVGHEPKFPAVSTSLPHIAGKFLFDAGFGPASRQNMFFGNAVRFLGLRKSEGENSTRGRLEAFYTNAADREWLQIFDAVA